MSIFECRNKGRTFRTQWRIINKPCRKKLEAFLTKTLYQQLSIGGGSKMYIGIVSSMSVMGAYYQLKGKIL